MNHSFLENLYMYGSTLKFAAAHPLCQPKRKIKVVKSQFGTIRCNHSYSNVFSTITIAGCTDKQHRGKGILTVGLKMVEEHCIQLNIRKIFTVTYPWLSRRVFLLRLGYEFTACRPHPIDSEVSYITVELQSVTF